MSTSAVPLRVIGRYALFDEVASGGMATVHVGRMTGPAGFSRIVAMKRMHAQFAKDPEFVTMFLDEARLAGRIRHPNVVPTLDIVAEAGELFIVMEYVEGESLSRLVKLAKERGEQVPVPVAAAVMVQALHGLHAAHEAHSDAGTPMGIIHRDVSPQNLLCGLDGMVRVVDFGIARARGRSDETRPGVVKGKAAYLAPEQLRMDPVDRRVDVYAAGVVLWELLSGERMFSSDDALGTINQILRGSPREPPSKRRREVGAALDAAVLRAIEHEKGARFATAIELADAIEAATDLASQRVVARWVESVAGDELAARRSVVSRSSEATADVTMQVPVSKSEDDTGPKPSAPPPSSPPPVSTPLLEETRSVVRKPGPAIASGPPPRPVEPRRPRPLRLFALITIGLLALGALAMFASGGAPDARPAAGSTPSVAAPALTAAATTAAPSQETVAPSASAPPEPPTATASATPSASATPTPTESVSASVRAPTPHRAPASRCTPPYYYEDGFKKFKPGCL